MYTYITKILYIVSTSASFNASVLSSESLNLVLSKVTKFLTLLKLQLNKNSRAKCDRCFTVKSIKC